ncbi:hypothetical protein BDR03DRAFT_987641 [Suillus americanus]|nr:hypothetical protein BDR03DRAFT_987641 [Suillus americanus]
MSSLQQADVAFLARLALHESAVGLVTDCTNCGGTVPITICRSDANGNSGKPMARTALKKYKIYQCRFYNSVPFNATSCLNWQWQEAMQARHQMQWCLLPCLTHCIEEVGGCPVHLTETDNQQQHPIMQQDWNWDYDQEDTLTLPAEPYWHDDHEVQTNDGLRALQHAPQSVSAGQPALFSLFHDILTAPAPSQPPVLTIQPPAPTTQPPAPSQQSHLPTLSQIPCLPMHSQNGDVLVPHAFLVHKLSKPPRVTDQLDPMWAGDLNMRAREEIESKRVSEHRKEMERASRQRFILYWFDADNTPVSMQWAVHCPYFPQYQLSDDPALVNSLGSNIEEIKVFEESFIGFDELFKSSKLLTRPSHMRFNMKDIEILNNKTQLTPKVSLGKHRQDGFDTHLMSPTPPLFPSQLPEDDFNSHHATSMSPTPLLTTSSFTSSIESTPSHQSAQAAPSVIPVHVPTYDRAKPPRVWPQGMYTIDMVVGFQQMDIPKLCGFYGQEQLFHLIFGDTPFVKATYHENHKVWCETHKQSGCTQDDLWSNCLAARHIALSLESKKHSRRK